MPSSFGTSLRLTVFGQSHSPAIGCVVEGLPAGVAIDMDAIRSFMARRAPGRNPWSTPRKETDEPRILSGLNPEGTTCGAPLAAIIENSNTRPGDYANIARIPRPGHADFVAWEKWGNAHDVSGGGHFSGRLTAPICLAGAICLQILAGKGIRVGAHLASVAGVSDEPFSALDTTAESSQRLGVQLDALADGRDFPVIDSEAGTRMVEEVLHARDEGDSVGGIIECVACGMPAGIGSPMFDGIENAIARAAFAIPAVKGIEFGRGFDAAAMRGSQHNDPFGPLGDACVPTSNNAGGILGGITTGAPILFRMAIKPTSSISREQRSVDLRTMEATTLAVRGRHDPCIAPRAVPVAEAICAIALLDALLSWPSNEVSRHFPPTSTTDGID